MTRAENKKNLSGDIPAELHDRLNDWISEHKDIKIRQCLQSMTELWLSLPDNLKATLLITKEDSPFFCNTIKEIEENMLPVEVLLGRKSEFAPNVIRRLLLLLQDYAATRDGIKTGEELSIALNAVTELFRWINPDEIKNAKADDLKIVELLYDILEGNQVSRQKAAIVEANAKEPAAGPGQRIEQLRMAAGRLQEGDFRILADSQEPEIVRFLDALKIQRVLDAATEKIVAGQGGRAYKRKRSQSRTKSV